MTNTEEHFIKALDAVTAEEHLAMAQQRLWMAEKVLSKNKYNITPGNSPTITACAALATAHATVALAYQAVYGDDE